MRKRMAVLLSIMMLGSLFQGMNLFAAETPSSEFIQTHKFTSTKEGLYEKIGTGLEKKTMTNNAEEAAVKWAMQQGKYKLTYHVMSSTGSTNQVELNFDVRGTDVDLTAQLNSASASAIPTRFVKSVFPYNVPAVTTTSTSFTAQLGINPATAEKRELSFIADNTTIRMYIENNTIEVWSNNIKKGYVTDFKLTYGEGAASESQTITFLNGLRSFMITPVHLITSAGNLESKDIIEDTDSTKPGSMPGVKVSFEMPMRIKEGEKEFTRLDPADASAAESATLAIWGEQRPGVKDTTLINNERNLNFKIKNNAAVIDTVSSGQVTVGKVFTDDKTVSIYMSHDRPDTDAASEGVVKWDSLEASMLLGAKLELAGGAFSNIRNTSFQPENNGHTYLKYNVYRASEQQICIEITPYNINGTVSYTVKERLGGSGEATNNFSNIITRMHTRTEENKNNTIAIFIPKTKADVYYQVEVDIGTNTVLNSQQLRFKPGTSIAPPPVTQIIRANNVYVIPPDTVSGSTLSAPEAIGFDIEWSAPNKTELDTMLSKGDIFYELSLYSPKKDNPQITKVFRVYKDTSVTYGSQIQVEVYGGSSNEGYQKGQYNSTTGTFEVKKVIIQNSGKADWERLVFPSDRLIQTNYTTSSLIELKDDLTYTVPGIYYLTMKGVFDSNDSIQQLATSSESSFTSISLDFANEIIPVPSHFANVNRSVIGTGTSVINYDIQIENVNVMNYVKNMLQPARIYLDDPSLSTPQYNKGTYELFIYQKNANRQEYSEADFENAMKNGPVLHKDESAAGSKLDMKEYLDRLRKGGILPVEYAVSELTGKTEKEILSLENLDPNQVYYIKARLRLNPHKLSGSGAAAELVPLKPRYSIFSSTYTFTTTTVPQPPKPEDKVPPTPKSFWVDSQPNNTTAILKWTKAEFEPDKDITKTYYEIARVTDVELKNNERSNQMTLEKLVGGNSSITGFNTSALNIQTITSGGMFELKPVQTSDSFRLEDVNLSPNTIYYYYIRTVCVINGVSVRSEWIMVPVTTQPVERPINLQVETPKNYSYDPKTETVISFLAPIPAGAKIPDQYEFEIAVQGEMDDTYRFDYQKVQLTSKENQSLMPQGYTHFVYKIHGLKPGKRYDIKVRIVDKTKTKQANAEYPRSLYSDKVTARTEFDQDEQDKDDKYAEYLKQFDDAVEKLRRMPYWQLDGENRFNAAYKYRASYISTEIAVQNTYELQSEKGATRLTYYLPADMLDKASEMNVMLTASLGNESITVRPYTLTSENEAIKRAVSKLDEKDIKDYYIKLEFYRMTASARVNGEDALSPEICIDMDLVYLDEEDMIIEDDIMSELNDRIAEERKDVITKLEKELDDNKIEEDELKDIIDDAIADIKKEHKEDVKDILKREKDTTASVTEIEKPILITSILDSFSVNGYYLEGKWVSVDVIQANGGFAIEAQKLGIYIFTGMLGIGTAVPEVAMNQNMIAKYNLTDFFTLNSYMIKTGATKEQVFGAVARILGAKRNTDYNTYLKAKGLKGITSVGIKKTIRQDESIYIIMQAYEIIHNKPVTSININNKRSVTNIGAFQPQYRAYVYAAVALDVVDNPNAKVLPSKEMSVEEIIKMLSSIAAK